MPYPEDESDTTLRNISGHQTTRRHIPKNLNLKKHRWDNLKSRMTMKLGLSEDIICLSTAIGLSPGGRTHLHTNNT